MSDESRLHLDLVKRADIYSTVSQFAKPVGQAFGLAAKPLQAAGGFAYRNLIKPQFGFGGSLPNTGTNILRASSAKPYVSAGQHNAALRQAVQSQGAGVDSVLRAGMRPGFLGKQWNRARFGTANPQAAGVAPQSVTSQNATMTRYLQNRLHPTQMPNANARVGGWMSNNVPGYDAMRRGMQWFDSSRIGRPIVGTVEALGQGLRNTPVISPLLRRTSDAVSWASPRLGRYVRGVEDGLAKAQRLALGGLAAGGTGLLAHNAYTRAAAPYRPEGYMPLHERVDAIDLDGQDPMRRAVRVAGDTFRDNYRTNIGMMNARERGDFDSQNHPTVARGLDLLSLNPLARAVRGGVADRVSVNAPNIIDNEKPQATLRDEIRQGAVYSKPLQPSVPLMEQVAATPEKRSDFQSVEPAASFHRRLMELLAKRAAAEAPAGSV